jgi:ferritin-like protein
MSASTRVKVAAPLKVVARTQDPLEFRQSIADLHQVLKAVLETESACLKTYQRLNPGNRIEDPATALLALRHLAAVVQLEDAVVRLIGTSLLR